MSLSSYLFGNVDEDGQLDSDIDQELRDSLNKIDSAGAERLFGNIFNMEGITDVKDKESSTIQDGLDGEKLNGLKIPKLEKNNENIVKPSADAVDFSDFNELAEDTEAKKRLYEIGKNAIAGKENTPIKSRMKEEENFDEDSEEENQVRKEQIVEEKKELKLEPPQNIANGQDFMPIIDSSLSLEEIKSAYPAFKEHSILKFTELFANPNFKVQRYPTIASKKTLSVISKKRIKLPEVNKDVDDKSLFLTDYIPGVTPNLLDHLIKVCKESALKLKPAPKPISPKEIDDEILKNTLAPSHYDPFHLEDWESKIIWDANKNQFKINEDPEEEELQFYNKDLDLGEWEDKIFWDEEEAKKIYFPLLLDLNDHNMLFEVASTEKGNEQKNEEISMLRLRLLKKAKKMGITGISLVDKGSSKQLDKFNLSNDLYYEAIKSGKAKRVRQTFGQIIIKHAAVANRLQQPFFKTKLTKNDLRRWHRKPIHFPIGVELKVNRVKMLKKKKLKMKIKPNEEFMQTPKEVTLKDNSPFILIEYSEEYPPIIQNNGMGSLLVNYYRKKDQDDDYIHDPEIGEPFTLEPTDVSPFMNFGNVEPGEFMMGLYNNLIKAPVFHHKPKPTDFLLIRYSLNGKSRYFIRELTDLYVAGQTYPQQCVPGPHSRLITSTIKNRLQVAAFRLIRANPKRHLKIQKLAKYFPEYNESQIRTKLKEFAEFQRNGPSTGYWKLKPNVPLPEEEELSKMVTPEKICLYESMLVGKRHLQDAGYGKSAEQEDENNELSLTIEEQLAPWITTRNFINATQGKAMLKLYGEGDPTGRGEGFSFVRVSMKDIFLRAGEKAEDKLAEIEARPKSAHRYNVAEQQQIYKEEITRIWNTQNAFLANQDDFELSDDFSDEDIVNNRPVLPLLKRHLSTDLRTAKSSRQSSLSPKHESPMEHGSIADTNGREDELSENGSVDSNGSKANANKVLIVKRLIKRMGVEEWVTEKITNPAVIKAYIRKRDAIKPPNSSEPLPIETMRKRTLEQLNRVCKSRDRRIARQKAQEAIQGGTIPSHLAPRGKKELIRRCGNCGELGHMKTNRKCPKYNGPY